MVNYAYNLKGGMNCYKITTVKLTVEHYNISVTYNHKSEPSAGEQRLKFITT